MIDLARYLPALMLAGGAGVAAKGGGEVGKHLLDTVKVVVVRFEMGAVAQGLEIEAVTGGRLPKSQSSFQAYLANNVKSRTGRDPTRDLWNNAYVLTKVDGKPTLVSYGPNGRRDRCHDQSSGQSTKAVEDAVDREIARAKRREEAIRRRTEMIERGEDPPALEDMLDEDVPDAPLEDDVCVYLALEARGPKGGGGGGIDGMLGNQSPYRQIER